MTLNRTIAWKGLELDTLEHAHVIFNGRDTRIRGTIIGPDFGLFYRLDIDGAARVRAAKIEHTNGGLLELFSDGLGNWSDNRAEPVAALKGCLDLDIWPTPMTNSLPLWRLEPEVGAPQHLALVYIDATDLSFSRVEQIYTKLSDTAARFQSAQTDAEITLDADGLVVNYPGLFKSID
ncbi:putative glycolipid-binding domain-containing protein [Devosia sp. WQ 349]|uniref:putative glycolipid-binding domain-containing protein n=1 Tax=Devosia sp. WQ 349K1 TaxID=2800329 RepID=UPI0019050A87|nr:putative glycolipid-binding domain-containing protein [Devosia sp. WQ 349K1]MBK1794701.1 putative glycolipid-binding domain-containing protein [Devosia sp. WQ 349K1]